MLQPFRRAAMLPAPPLAPGESPINGPHIDIDGIEGAAGSLLFLDRDTGNIAFLDFFTYGDDPFTPRATDFRIRDAAYGISNSRPR